MLTHDAVAALGRTLCGRIGTPRHELWFKDKTKFQVDADDQLIVGVPNCFYQDWLREKFADDVSAAAAEVLGKAVTVSFVIDPELFQAERKRQAETPSPSSVAAPVESLPAPPAQESNGKLSRLRVRRWRHLGEFVVGPANRVAHAAALNLVEEPGMGPIPLVLHGPVGSGKSHLLEGIYAGLKQTAPEARIVYLTAEDFTNRFLASVHGQKQAGFRKQFRDCDVLLVDDLHFLARKTATQEEFLHTLETLQRDGRPVIVTCDAHPRLADLFLPELTDRLSGGAVYGLGWPDAETRRGIIRNKTRDRASLPADVVDYLASSLRGNVRELEGAMHSLFHLAKVTDRPITLELCQEALAEVLRAAVRTVQLVDIDRSVANVFRLPSGALQSKQRRAQFSNPRMLAIYLARKHTAATYGEVGRYFGNRNHSTAVAAEKKVRVWLTGKDSLPIGDAAIPVRDLVERVEAELSR